MKIAVIGAGAAGSVFASYLLRGGADVTLVDLNKAHMDKVAADGMTFVIAPDETYQLTGFKTAYSPENIGIMDVVVVMTKVTSAEAALQSAACCIGPETVLVSLMNGLGNDDKLVKFAPPDRCLYGSGVLGTELPEPGKCISSPADGVQMNFGAVEKGPLTDSVGKYLEKCFNDGGLTAMFREDIKYYIWQKAIVNSVFNPLCAILRMKVKDVMADPYGLALCLQVINEGCAVATAMGCPFDTPSFVKTIKSGSSDSITNYYPSMAQDMLMFKRQTEISSLNGAISNYGKKLGIPTPACDMITKMVTCMERHYDLQYQE